MDDREAFGWFGIPWWSGICYDDDGRLTEEMRKEFPTGETCYICEELFDETAGESGTAIPSPEGIRHTHKECMLLEIIGPVDRPGMGMSIRQTALEVWQGFRKRYGTSAEA